MTYSGCGMKPGWNLKFQKGNVAFGTWYPGQNAFKGYICMGTDIEYTPGARFYFDTQELIQDGLLINDGTHYKVKDELPLSYSLFCATMDNISISGKITPKSFADAADEAFNQFVNNCT